MFSAVLGLSSFCGEPIALTNPFSVNVSTGVIDLDSLPGRTIIGDILLPRGDVAATVGISLAVSGFYHALSTFLEYW